jgi:peptidyl-prolyl cis-trans isomerase C
MRLWFLALLLLPCGCPGKQDPELLPVVEIDEQSAITVRDYRRAVARLRLEREGEDAGPLPKELHQHLLDQLIEQRVLALEAERLGVKASTVAVAKEIAAMKRALPDHRFERFLSETYQTERDLERAIGERLASDALLAREVKVEISEAELKQAWEKLPEERRLRPARVHCAQIMLPTEDGARAIVKKLRAKKDVDFAALARAHSVAPEAEQGGDLGWFEKGDMPAVFDQACFSLAPGDVSDLTPSELGYHVFKVIEREEERPLTFEEAKETLTSELRSSRQRERERALIESLLAKHQVVRHQKRIPLPVE